MEYNISGIFSQQDYSPFGMPMPGRSLSLSNYRFGFNTQEKVDEIKGIGNHNTALFWEYDTRLGRRWNRDPITRPWESPYLSIGNNPIVFNDPFGDEITGTRQAKRDFKKQSKINGTWAEIKQRYKGKNSERNLRLTDTRQVNEPMSNAKIQEFTLSGANINDRQDYLYFNSHPTGSNESQENLAFSPTTSDPIDLIPSKSISGIPVPETTPVLKEQPSSNTQSQVPRVNFNVTAPFIPGQPTFSNPTVASTQLQQAANAFLNSPGANRINIIIGTSTVNLNQPANNTLGQTVNQLLWSRGRAVQNQLLQMGVPITAFGNGWLQFGPGSTISTTIQVR